MPSRMRTLLLPVTFRFPAHARRVSRDADDERKPCWRIVSGTDSVWMLPPLTGLRNDARRLQRVQTTRYHLASKTILPSVTISPDTSASDTAMVLLFANSVPVLSIYTACRPAWSHVGAGVPQVASRP